MLDSMVAVFKFHIVKPQIASAKTCSFPTDCLPCGPSDLTNQVSCNNLRSQIPFCSVAIDIVVLVHPLRHFP